MAEDCIGVDCQLSVKQIELPTIEDSELSDAQTIKRIRNGRIEYYQLIMRRYNQRLYRIARSIVGDDEVAFDMVQSAHLKAYEKLNQFDEARSFSAWLCVIVKNESLMWLRRQKMMVSNDQGAVVVQTGGFDVDWSSTSRESRPDMLMENAQLIADIEKHIDELPEAYRVVLTLRGIEQLTVAETAQILGIKSITVKTRYFRAKAFLRQRLQAQMDSLGDVYQFGGKHCDQIVINVMEKIYF